ncbi:glycosyltransferase family 39 protein [Knoellia locipacati]|uniref:Membrane protein n=1 Tax=Knoellia locipacati TaxID=882824 RepID=A0A512T0D8_9MICO|nr:mannosyltransferase family protein [Knoellia locipacati]GEQ13687.1 membrane protein [Knoellia locipacati]
MTTLRTSPAVRAGVAFLGSRLLLGLTVLAMAAVAGQGAVAHEWASGVWWLDRFSAWDSYHFVRIATLGYLPPGLDCCDQAFFPGYPMLMAALAPLTGGSVTGAGVLTSLVAGAIAAALLWQLVRDDARGGPVAARRAVLMLALAPCGFFLVAVYTEALFLALALGAWLLASRRHWWWAGALAALATGVRVNGLFLAAGLAVMYALQWHHDGRPRPRWDVLALGLPALSIGGYVLHLHSLTGSWDAWREAEHRGWDRSTATPWTGIATAWQSLLDSPNAWLAASRAADIVAVLLGVAVCLLLARQRRWPELTYLSLTVGVVLCSTLWVSAPRYALTWFPAYLAVGTIREGTAYRRLYAVGLGLSAVLLVGATWAAATRHWIA